MESFREFSRNSYMDFSKNSFVDFSRDFSRNIFKKSSEIPKRISPGIICAIFPGVSLEIPS